MLQCSRSRYTRGGNEPVDRRQAGSTGLRAMIAELLGLVAAIVVVIALARSISERAGERASPGRSAKSALAVEDYGDIDTATRRETCACGGRFVLRSEGPLTHHGRPLRVAQLECRRCGRGRRLYFDLSTLKH